MADPSYVLALDLGTSRLKVGLVDETLRTRVSARRSYETLSDAPGMAEQRPEDWLAALGGAVRDVLSAAPDARVDAVVLTAQMPTLVALDETGAPLGRAVTWQDGRADDLVLSRLDDLARRRVREVAGTPIDGRYLVPMHLRREAADEPRPAMLLSAKDYLYFVLTGRYVTDASTASGYGTYALATRDWSEELFALWAVRSTLVPEIVASNDVAPLSAEGATLLGVAAGTPVVVGGADSVCAHHYVERFFPGAVTVVDGSSTVIMATVNAVAAVPPEVLVTPLVDARRVAVELDLLATGSTLDWLSRLLSLTTAELELLALSHADPVGHDLQLLPYLAGSEQGVLWLGDVAGSLHGLTLASTAADLALAAFEGVAFESARCLELVAALGVTGPLVSLATPGSAHFGAALVAALGPYEVRALAHESPSLLGAALLAHEAVGTTVSASRPDEATTPELSSAYRGALAAKAARYRSLTPESRSARPA